MMRTLRSFYLTVFIFAFALMTASCSKNAGGEGVLAGTDSSFQKEVLDSKVPVLVDFWATWCGPCRIYGPIVDQLAIDYKGRLKVVRVDVDQNPGLSRNFRINAIPNSILFQNGNIVKTWMGLVSEEELKIDVEKVVGPGAQSKHI
jgi:thioredoxin 1